MSAFTPTFQHAGKLGFQPVEMALILISAAISCAAAAA
jgi:hypothetical protein